MHSKHTFFGWACMIALMQASTLTLFIACQWCAEEGRKKEAHWLRNGFFVHKTTKEKNAKIDWEIFFHAQNDQRKNCKNRRSNLPSNLKKVRKSWTINRKCRHVWDKYKVRKEKGKRIILSLQTTMASNLPVSIMVKFLFASRWALLRTAAERCALCFTKASHYLLGLLLLCRARILDFLRRVPSTLFLSIKVGYIPVTR